MVADWGWCELEPGQDGSHFLPGRQSTEQVWWLCWHDEQDTRQLRSLPPYPAEGQPDERGDTAPCVLFLPYPERQSFSYEIGDYRSDNAYRCWFPRATTCTT
jgi:hypothetical protein